MSSGPDESADTVAPGVLSVLRIRAFAVLFSAEIQSLVGDQLARVALSVLVFDQTHDAAATAATYAATFLPAILGGAVLARIADKVSRRAVMIGADLVRAVLFGLMALPALPLVVLEVLLVAAVFLEPAFTAAQSGYLSVRLGPDQYRAATGLRMAASQLAQVGGFGVGGAVVVFVHPRGALLIDAISFALSAAVISLGLRAFGRRTSGRTASSALTSTESRPRRPAPGPSAQNRAWRARSVPRIVYLFALTSLAGLFVVPEGLAVPFATEAGDSTKVAGILLASIPAGGAVGALLLLHVVPPARRSLCMTAMAVACGLPLVLTAAHPPWPVVAALWFVSGLAAAYQVEIFSDLAQIVPNAHRGRIIGMASAYLTGAQGIGLAVFGFVAQSTDSGTAVGMSGALGVLLAGVTVVAWSYRSRALASQGGQRPANA